MLLRHSRLIATLSLLLVTAASSAGAAVLWDQSNLIPSNDGTINLGSNACSQISGNTRVHTTSDVTFASPVIINSISIWETQGNVQAATQAYLYIAPKTGPAPTDNSTMVYNPANLVSITSVLEGSVVKVTASGLNRALPAGDYWVSLTPRHNLGLYPYSWHIYTAGPTVGSPTHAIVACTENNTWYLPLAPAEWDYSLRIEGELPVPAVSTSWGQIKSTYR